MDTTIAATAHSLPSVVVQRRLPAQDNRPAWARPQPSWPFRVIDPQAHRPGAPAQAPGWSS